jgi:hypothetical protein
MTTSRIDELLTKIHVKSYESNQPILQTVIENDSILYLLMKISEGQLSESDIDLYYHTLSYLNRKSLIIEKNNTYYLTDISKATIEKIKYELKLLKNINNENLDSINIYSLLESVCKNIVEINRSKKIEHPFSYIIFQRCNQQGPLTSYFVGKDGIILISLYSLSCKERKCYNWWYSPKQIKEFLFNNIPKCYDIFRNKLDINPLVKFGLVDQRKGGDDISRYKLSEEGYNVAKFILKNLAIVYKYY